MNLLKAKKYNLESFSAGHFFEDLTDEDSFYVKKFFGGLSVYVYGKMVAFLCDRPGHKISRGRKYKIDLWNGCLIPSEREFHHNLLKLIPGTSQHPVIDKWIYLPKDSIHFESSMIRLNDLIRRKNIWIGIEPHLRKSKKKKTASKASRPKVKKEANATQRKKISEI